MNKILLTVALVVFGLVGCAEPVIEEGVNLESKSVLDSSLLVPAAYLISEQDSIPNLPVVVAVHGFSASTFEWTEFRTATQNELQVSLTLLGGHGRSYQEFKESTWQDWQTGPLAELTALQNKNIPVDAVICSSTGCPLMIAAMESGWFKNRPAPKWFFMVDPIVFPSNKLLTLVDIVGPILGNVEVNCTEAEKPYWYCNRPAESLDQLMNLLTHVRGALEDGVQAPQGSKVVVYKSKHDGSADPVSALALYKGLKNGDGTKIEMHMVNSSLHVFTRLALRDKYSAADVELQQSTFQEILAKITESK